MPYRRGQTWIKICGLTDPENARDCAALNPDAIGLVFCRKSPRYVRMDQAAAVSGVLPDHVQAIGVFVDDDYDFIMKQVSGCGLTGVQLHGRETPTLVARLRRQGLLVIKALFAAGAPDFRKAPEYPEASFFLVEHGRGTLPGGNRQTWDYQTSEGLKTEKPVVIAGGLDPGTVGHALKSARPAGVDVSSGVEKRYGFKDIEKVRSFITAVRQMNRVA